MNPCIFQFSLLVFLLSSCNWMPFSLFISNITYHIIKLSDTHMTIDCLCILSLIHFLYCISLLLKQPNSTTKVFIPAYHIQVLGCFVFVTNPCQPELSLSMATAHHHFRVMIGLWSLVRYWLESQPFFHVVTICLSLSIDHQLLPLTTGSVQLRRNCQTTYFFPLLYKDHRHLTPSPPTALPFLTFKTQNTDVHAHSQFHKCSVNRQDDGESKLMFSYWNILSLYLNTCNCLWVI